MGDLILAIVFAVFSLAMLFVSFDYPFFNNNTLGAGAWPQMILGAMLVLSLIWVFSAYRKYKTNKPEKKEVTEKNYTHWIMFGIFFVTPFVVDLLGFSITLLIFIPLVAYLLGMKSKKAIILTTVIATLVISIVFVNVLRINLPEGAGIIKTINRVISMKLFF